MHAHVPAHRERLIAYDDKNQPIQYLKCCLSMVSR